ncbi:hypothetical protein HOD20_01475 [archaeon]|nr:hypothetical protein [archaeon]MBT4647426.1 hypothetical protein [archaeon]MBT6820790.1 hypothetical protein [archaeon]MBT7392125.1 hypothetical protein [archaeon]
MRSKKAQLEMMQTAFVLLILFVVFTLVGIFYIGYQKTGIRAKQREIEGLEIIKRSQVLNFLPELQCSFDGIVYHDCYDSQKIAAFREQIQNPEKEYFYRTLLGDISIIISKFNGRILERGWTDPNFEKYDPENPNPQRQIQIIDEETIKEKDKRLIQFPVSIYDPNNDVYDFGVIFLEIYQ